MGSTNKSLRHISQGMQGSVSTLYSCTFYVPKSRMSTVRSETFIPLMTMKILTDPEITGKEKDQVHMQR